MFRCQMCKRQVVEKVSPVKLVIEQRQRSYQHVNADDEVVVTYGHEIVSEMTVCQECYEQSSNLQRAS